ncbi:MAG: class I SAM-dependent methyltransferase [Nitrososphaerota archaeon]|nr:class I SAM-dependent methyltransferase [Nitrososphaerota archaeon]
MPFLFSNWGKSYSLNHLGSFDDYAQGPMQRDEALLLYALVKTVDPKTIVEFGFFLGNSAINFLKSMSRDARLYSFDIWDVSKQAATQIKDPRFKFIFKSQTDFEPADIDNNTVNLAFFDAAHDFDLNVTTFAKLKDSLAEKALIVVHDTGAWYVNPKGFKTEEGYFLNGSATTYIHRPGERKFVNYIKTNGGFDQIHLHSTSKFRHGLTILQKNAGPLPL